MDTTAAAVISLACLAALIYFWLLLLWRRR
jgi:hypothetical protein